MVDSNAAVPSTEDDVRAVAERHGLGAREIAALTVFVDRVADGSGQPRHAEVAHSRGGEAR